LQLSAPCFKYLYIQVYERAVANLPPATEKRYWQRYIYLWIKYALFEELEAENPERAREVYRACLKLIPHQIFTFSKVCTDLHPRSVCLMYPADTSSFIIICIF
jgi:hypothetical protein